MNAYEIAQELSKLTTNRQRKQFISEMADRLASITGRTVEKQEIAIDERFGNMNFLLLSNDPNPLIISAHYDAFLISGETTTPGANDNGSGIGLSSKLHVNCFTSLLILFFLEGKKSGAKALRNISNRTPNLSEES